MLIAQKLKELRGNKKQIVVAAEIGITPQALNNYEQGLRIPRDEVKVKIAKYYCKSVEEIFFSKNVHYK